MPLPALAIRPLLHTDQDVLWDLLHVALWDPPPALLRPREVLDSPHVRIYAENWGRTGDVGVIGTIGTETAGACWMRLVPNQQGLAFVDDVTPQLGIALFPTFQGRGYGRQLMLAAVEAAGVAGYGQVSLTVHPENPAIAMYERCGFRQRAMRNNYQLMVATI